MSSKNKIAVLLIMLAVAGGATYFIFKITGDETASADYYKQEGKKYFTFGDFEKSEENYKKALEMNPSCSVASYQLGNIYLRYKDYDRAKEYFNDALGKNPESLIKKGSYLGLAGAYFFEEEYGKSIDYINLALEDSDVFTRKELEVIGATAYPMLANSLFLLGNFSASEEYFQKTLRLDIKDLKLASLAKENAYNGLGFLYSSLGEDETAIEYFNESINLNTDSALKYLPYFGIGQSYIFLNDYDKALEFLQTSLSLIDASQYVPDYSFNKTQIYNFLGKAYLEIENFSQAENSFNSAIEVTETETFDSVSKRALSSSKAYLGLGEISFRLNNCETALSFFEQGLKNITSVEPKYFSEKTNFYFFEILLRYQKTLLHISTQNALEAQRELGKITNLISSLPPEIYSLIENLSWFNDEDSLFEKVNALQNEN